MKSILVTGAFIENGIANWFRGKTYISKIPGDIVWERARNQAVTNLDILEFQKARLNWKYRIFRFLFQESIRRSSRVIAPSMFIKILVQNWGISESQIKLVYNSVCIENYSPRSTLEKKYDVLTIARLVPWKGIAELIEVCAELNLSLCVAGDGPELQNLKNITQKTSAQVEFLGEIEPSKVKELFRGAKIFVLNSSYEGLPHVLIEAQASGIPTIAREGTGSAEVVSDGINGLLVGDIIGRTLKDALDWALKHEDESLRIAETAFLNLQNRFDQSQNFSKILSLLSPLRQDV